VDGEWRGIEGGCFGVIVIVVFGGEECIGGADNFDGEPKPGGVASAAV